MFKNKAFLGIIIALTLSAAAPALAQTASYYTGPSYIRAPQTGYQNYQQPQHYSQYQKFYNPYNQNWYQPPQPRPQPIPDYHLNPQSHQPQQYIRSGGGPCAYDTNGVSIGCWI